MERRTLPPGLLLHWSLAAEASEENTNSLADQFQVQLQALGLHDDLVLESVSLICVKKFLSFPESLLVFLEAQLKSWELRVEDCDQDVAMPARI